LRPSSGAIEVLGGPPGRDRAFHIGFLPEERGLYRRMTTLQTVIYFGQLKGLSRGAAHTAATQLIERFGLAQFRDSRVDHLSKGMAQKVQLATALVNAPKLLLLDEPFSGLDPVNQAALEDEILQAARRGSTVLFSTHVMEHAERICARLIILAGGRKVFDGDQQQAKATLPRRVWLRAKADPSGLPGVVHAEHLRSAEAGWTDWQIILELGREPGDLLQACVERGFALRGFEAHPVSLHDVFLHLAGPPPGQAI
ncbi:MAG: ATP-binding cassette domain-containing protein, partial [Acidobacteriaceae bacterium]|nr:ATP-binding cassette domain-containing protein [Acidobacteriaceae bacterium]